MAKAKDRDNSAHLLVDYWSQSARPLVSLVFILPMLLIYEGGILMLGPAAVHNGAAIWLQRALAVLGFGQYILLPLLTCALLLAWHYVSRQPWRVSPLVPPCMLVEAICLAVGLVIVWKGFRAVLGFSAPGVFLSLDESAGQIAGYFGAGIYEELLFRLLLLSSIAFIVRSAGAQQRASVITAVLVSSLLFALAHYRFFGSGGDEFTWLSFTFRLLAGIYFSLLFVLRGFGIAAGSHALYDVFVYLRIF